MPTQLLVSVTPAIRAFLLGCGEEGAAERAEHDAVDMDELYRIAGSMRGRQGVEAPRIHELLEGAEVLERRRAPEPEPLSEVQRMRQDHRSSEGAWSRACPSPGGRPAPRRAATCRRASSLQRTSPRRSS
ncbi:unnamed protein product [Prorocentrum cordatum]|uniref:Uncharacterized protein n=1 Tax=Prorocentrum cordatum TaxID=2364126 RepID=A0ABN9U3P3_9DINO|nr:unnamed protein product [Polarella glacialis]